MVANLMVYRCLKTACHELCHVFGITHCPYFECLMNGSNLIEEADKKPFALCPLCLRKIETYLELNTVEALYSRFARIGDHLYKMRNPSF